MKYYLWINETQDGPFEDWDILKRLKDREITLETLACEESASETKWIKVAEIPAVRWSDFGSKPQPLTSKTRNFESSVGFFSSSFGRIYLLLGIIIAIFTAISGNIPIAVAVLLSSIAASIFFIALGEIIHILKDIRSELKNHRAP